MVDVEGSGQEHGSRNASETRGARDGPALPTASTGLARQAGPRLSESPVDNLRSRMLLASASGLPEGYRSFLTVLGLQI